MNPFDLVHPSVIREQSAYAAAARGPISRLWRCLVAAWRCSRAVRRRQSYPQDVRDIIRARRGASVAQDADTDARAVTAGAEAQHQLRRYLCRRGVL